MALELEKHLSPEKSWSEKPVFIGDEQACINFGEKVQVWRVSVHFLLALRCWECIIIEMTFQVVTVHILIRGEIVELHIWPSGHVTTSSDEVYVCVCLWV